MWRLDNPFGQPDNQRGHPDMQIDFPANSMRHQPVKVSFSAINWEHNLNKLPA